MKIKSKLSALLCLLAMLAGTLCVPVFAEGQVDAAVAQIGEVKYTSLKEAVAAVPKGKFVSGADNFANVPKQATTIKLLTDTNDGIDIGKSGQEIQNVIIDLNGYTLTLGPAIGSTGTETNGLRVLSYSNCVVKNGTVVCSDMINDKGGLLKLAWRITAC